MKVKNSEPYRIDKECTVVHEHEDISDVVFTVKWRKQIMGFFKRLNSGQVIWLLNELSVPRVHLKEKFV